MKHFFKITLQIILLITIIFFSGCGEMTRTEKTLCYNLTSRSFAYIPPCETETSCYEKVSEMFNTDLGYEQEIEMYKLKNNLARSWFFYNKAIKEIKKAPNYCLNDEGVELTGVISQTSQYLDYSFNELDLAVKKSFEIVINEEKLLSSQEIDLVKEEELFDSLIELRQINSEIETEPTNSGTYYSYYYERIKEFNVLGIRKGFSQLIEEDSITLKIGRIIGKEVYTGFDLKEIKIPLIGLSYNNIQNTVENILFKEQNLRELERFPIYEFTLLYSTVGGTNNSAIKRFSDLINKTSNNKKKTQTNLTNTWKNIELEKKKLNELKSNLKIIYKYTLIQEELLSKNISGEKKIEEIINNIENQYINLKKEKNLSNISLGAELSRAKNIHESLMTTNNKLDFENNTELKKMSEACDKKAKEITSTPLEISTLENIYSEQIFYSKKVMSTQNEEKLNYCIEMIKTNKEYVLGLMDYTKLEIQKTSEIRYCFEYLENIFNQIKMPILETYFKNLKNEKVTSENLIYFYNSCSSIKTQAENEIKSNPEIKEILNEYKKTKLFKEKIIKMRENFIENLEELEIKSKTFDKYFNQENLIEIYLIKSELLTKIKKNNNEIEKLIETKLTNYLKNNYKLIVLSNTIPTVNEDINSTLRINISNPFWEINTPFSMEINQNMKQITTHPCLTNYISGEKTTLIFNCLNFGDNSLDFYSKFKVETIEREKIIYATTENSLIQKNIKLVTENSFPKLLITTNKNEKINIIVDEKEIKYFFEDNKLKFYIENATNKSNINIYYYITNLISIQSELVSEKELGTTKELTYKVIVKNNYEKELIGTIIFPIYTNNFVNTTEIYDDEKIQKKSEVIDKKLVLKNINFLAKEEKNFLIKITISNKYEYYFDILNSIKNELINYGEIKLVEEINKTLEKIEFIDEKEIQNLIKKSENELNKLKEKFEEESNLNLIKENLIKEIKNYEEKINDLEKYGLIEEKELLLKRLNLAKILLESTKRSDILKGISLLQNEPLSINEEIKKEVEKLVKVIKESVGKDPLQIKLSQEFFNKKEEFDQWKEIDLIKSKEIFLELKEIYRKYFEDKNKLVNLNSNGNEKMSNMLKECKEYLEFLEKELSIEETELINAKFIQPITLSRLKKLKLEITEIENNIFSIEKEEELFEIRGELKAALDSIKKQTINLYNTSIDKKIDEELLRKAKNYIDSNKFVLAFLSLKNNSKSGELMPFLGLIPIGFIVILALILKKILKKKENEEDKNKKIVLQEWDN